MIRFLVRRLVVALLVAATVMTLAFILTRLSGDLAISIAGPNATQADVEVVRKAYGLDRPVVTQLFDWVGRAVTGDLGDSYFFKTRVSTLIGERMPVTLTLGLTVLPGENAECRMMNDESGEQRALPGPRRKREVKKVVVVERTSAIVASSWWRCSARRCRRSGSGSS